MNQKQIDEVMEMVKHAVFCAVIAQLCESEGDEKRADDYQETCDRAITRIEAKLRELTCEQPS